MSYNHDNHKKNDNHKVANPRLVIPANAGIYGIADSFVVDSCIRRNDNHKKNDNHKVATPRLVIPANAGIYGTVDSFVVDSCIRRNDNHKRMTIIK